MIPTKYQRGLYYNRIIRLNMSNNSIKWKVIGFSGEDIVLECTESKWISRTSWDEFSEHIRSGNLKLIDYRLRAFRVIKEAVA